MIKSYRLLTVMTFIGLLSACDLDKATNQVSSAPAKTKKAKCSDQFYQEAPPYLQREKQQKDTYALCYQGFNVLYSGVSKTPLWVAEHLTPQRLSHKIKREDNFHEEEKIPQKHRALLKDYRGSGFDRGHMAPNGDMPDTASQYDSFALTNMVPQHPKNNQNIWRDLEEATRAMVTKHQQDGYIVTGPTYETKQLKSIGNGVMIPTAVYKAVYYPKSGVIGAYYAVNDDSQRVQIMSICALEQKIGINLFPQLTEEEKRQVFDLPKISSDVKAGQTIKQLSVDKKSKCATSVSPTEIKWLKNQFQSGNFQPLSYNITAQSLQQSSPSSTNQPSDVHTVVKTVMTDIVTQAALTVVQTIK